MDFECLKHAFHSAQNQAGNNRLIMFYTHPNHHLLHMQNWSDNLDKYTFNQFRVTGSTNFVQMIPYLVIIFSTWKNQKYIFVYIHDAFENSTNPCATLQNKKEK